MEKQNMGQQLPHTKKLFRLNTQRGSVAVEFALILPILAVLLFGIVDFGRMLWFKEVLVSATRDGARMGTLYSSGNTEAIIQGRVQTALVNGGMAPTNLIVTAAGNPETMITGQPVTVISQVDWNYLVIDKLLPNGWASTQLQAAVTMLHE
jgi:Flp pilus assembly protein TadG